MRLHCSCYTITDPGVVSNISSLHSYTLVDRYIWNIRWWSNTYCQYAIMQVKRKYILNIIFGTYLPNLHITLICICRTTMHVDNQLAALCAKMKLIFCILIILNICTKLRMLGGIWTAISKSFNSRVSSFFSTNFNE